MSYDVGLSDQEMLDSVKEDSTPDSAEQSQQQSGEQSKKDSKEPQLYEYQAAGKKIREPLDIILKRASQGYDYAQRMQQFNTEKADWQKQLESIKGENEKLRRWSEYDQYAKDNPEWAKHVENMWSERERYNSSEIDPNDPMAKRFSDLTRTLDDRFSKYDDSFKKFDEFIQNQQMKSETDSFNSEIDAVKTQYKDVDFNATDETGKSLETRVMEHMQKYQIPSFRAGFRDFYHDNLLSSAKERAAKEIQQKNRQGLLGVSSTPKGDDSFSNGGIRQMSWEDLAEKAKGELGF
jgi:hypothetical protein